MFDIATILEVLIKSVVAVAIGIIIGRERAKHGRAAGMRTHVLVCLGACMTSMTSVYVAQMMNLTGDVFRIPAQVVSGVGFLGAGMIILKSNHMISGLTTAAGVWTTATIGVAIGYGFYIGVIIVTALYLIAIVLLAKLEKTKSSNEAVYIEIDDLYSTNDVIDAIAKLMGEEPNYQIIAPKSGRDGNLGLSIASDKSRPFSFDELLKIDHVAYVADE